MDRAKVESEGEGKGRKRTGLHDSGPRRQKLEPPWQLLAIIGHSEHRVAKPSLVARLKQDITIMGDLL
ncbi:hypothetical protein PT974_04880 [Cladobotryum mycophilum]|uniref:Uncharacterized protein n=1 Tax=Cladobotryum mycophilum TaxID=491253 RepID=A0ABR0SQF4_9HYPO